MDYTLDNIGVKGFISQPHNARSNRTMQSFFINGRYVKSKTMQVALEEGCRGSVMVGKFPSCVLYLDISAQAVDVNVHPAKTEVRFENEKPVFNAVYHAVKCALNKGEKKPEIELKDIIAPVPEPKKTEPVAVNAGIPVESVKEEKWEPDIKDIMPPKPNFGRAFYANPTVRESSSFEYKLLQTNDNNPVFKEEPIEEPIKE